MPSKEEMNHLFIDGLAGVPAPRPHPLSLWGPDTKTPGCAGYVSWTGLVDRSYTARHLPPAPSSWQDRLPAVDDVLALFDRVQFEPCPRSTTLFCFFAQWFTDSFLRTHPADVRRNTSNHEIDLCQIYGLNGEDTACLRRFKGGKLKSQRIAGEEYPCFLFDKKGDKVRKGFRKLSYIHKGDFRPGVLTPPFHKDKARRSKLFAGGLENGNTTVFYSAINTVFLREHNRLCKVIAKENPGWNDHQLFETARNANIATLLKVIVEDYIHHIAGKPLAPVLEKSGWAEERPWYRTNRIAAEFNLLYRWHSLVPTACIVAGTPLDNATFRFNNGFLISSGLETLLRSASVQKAGRIGLANTPAFLREADRAAIVKSRAWGLRSYNDYREHFKLKRVKTFEELTDRRFVAPLQALYASVDDVELLVGLLAEKRGARDVLGELMSIMVGSDAFSQALTNPLLSKRVWGEDAFSRAGLASIESTTGFDSVVQRNTRRMQESHAVFTRADAMADIPRTQSSRSMPAPADEIPGNPRMSDDECRHGFSQFRKSMPWDAYFSDLARQHGAPVFHVGLMQPMVAVLDAEAMQPLFTDRDLTQDYGFGWAVPLPPLVGDVRPSIYDNGSLHDGYKALYLDWLRIRSSALQPVFMELAASYGRRWEQAFRFGFTQELEALTMRLAFKWLLGMDLADAEPAIELYLNLFTHRPGTTDPDAQALYARSKRAFDDLLAQVRVAPCMADIHALARSHGLEDEEETCKQMLFVVGMNAFLGLQNLAKSIVGEFGTRPDVRAEVAAEITAALDGRWPKTLEELAPDRLPLLDAVLREVLRLHPPVNFVFGRASRDREITAKGRRYVVRKDQLLVGVLHIAQRDPALFDEPDVFRPKRFLNDRVSRGLIWPRGGHPATPCASDRICPGKDASLLAMKLLCVWLLTHCEWTLETAAQWPPRPFSLNVSAPEGPMTAVQFRVKVPDPAQAA